MPTVSVCRQAADSRDWHGHRPALRRRFSAVAAAGAAAALLSSCQVPDELGADFVVKNATSMTLTVGEQGEVGPGATPPGAGGLTPLKLAPGLSDGWRIGLDRGHCTDTEGGFAAYDQAGHLVATFDQPICKDKHGNPTTWTIKQP